MHWSKDPKMREVVIDKLRPTMFSIDNNPNKGKHLPKEHADKISKAQIGISVPTRGNRNKRSPEVVRKWKQTFYSKPVSDRSEAAKKTHTPEADDKRRTSMAEHKSKVLEVAEKYRKDGWEVVTELDLRPDMIVRKGCVIKAVEVQRGGMKHHNYDKQKVFDDVIWEGF